MWEWLSNGVKSFTSGADGFKNVVGAVGGGLSALGSYNAAQNQKKAFNAMFDLEKAQIKRENDKEDERQGIINSVYAPKL